MNIRIPRRLERLLCDNPKWHASVCLLLEHTADILQTQPLYFADYPSHGIRHINTVLEYADILIDKESLTVLTSRDIAFLVSAIAIHDIGLYLWPEALKNWILDSPHYDVLQDLGDEPWDEVWWEYLDEVSRYSIEKMRQLFGEPVNIDRYESYCEPVTDADRRIGGTFLHRHHPRLAHEIALHGIPSSQVVDLFQDTAFTLTERHLIGTLARSHGMGIRDTESYMQHSFGLTPFPCDTPFYYLMAVLRIADCLETDIYQGSLTSTTDEWAWRTCIGSGKNRWDLQSMQRRIYAFPRTSVEYVQLDQWLKSAQSELDQCLLFVAEKYDPGVYRLSIRHITCNIHDPGVQHSFNEHAFLAKEVRLTSTTDFIYLTIPALYENTPSYAVRELIQNAVDACLEREYTERFRGNAAYRGRIEAHLDTKEGILTITDNGIGMDENILTNYLLSAGASYRSSDAWKREYIDDDQLRIPRTGKFGIGFLSVFLLGRQIQVATRHIYDDIGYQFQLDNTDRPLNIIRTRLTEAGTTISIRLFPQICDALMADTDHPWTQWYAFDDPEIIYTCNGETLPGPSPLLSRDPAQNIHWFPLDSDVFPSYQWKSVSGGQKPEFYCNGIRIYGCTESDLSIYGLNISAPHVSLTDAIDALDVNLPRTAIRQFPERDALYREVFCHCIARLLTTRWDSEDDYRRNLTLGFPLDPEDGVRSTPFLLSPDGFTLNYVSVLSAMEIDQYVLLYCTADDPRQAVSAARRFLPGDLPVLIVCHAPPAHTFTLPESSPYHFHSAAEFTEDVLSGQNALLSASVSLHGYTRYLAGIWLQENTYWGIRLSRFPYLRSSFRDPVSNIRALDWLEGAAPGSPEMPVIREQFDPEAFPVAMQFDMTNEDYHSEKYSDPELLFPRILRELLTPDEAYPCHDLWIPYSMEERKKKFPKAFEELKVYMDHIRKYPVE